LEPFGILGFRWEFLDKALNNIMENLTECLPLKRFGACAQLIDQATQSPYITFDCEATKIDGLRREIVRGSSCAFPHLIISRNLFGQSEVTKLDESFLHHKDINQLNVSMDAVHLVVYIVEGEAQLEEPTSDQPLGDILVRIFFFDIAGKIP